MGTRRSVQWMPAMDPVRERREPLGGLSVAADGIEVINAAFLSTTEGRRVTLGSA